MLPLLADALPAPDSPQAVGWMVLTIFALIGGVYYILCVWRMITGKDDEKTISPQPLVVKAHSESSSREELEKIETQLHGRLKRERAEIDARIERVEEAASERADKLEKKIDDNTSLTTAMSGEVKHINQNVQLILTAITRNKIST